MTRRTKLAAALLAAALVLPGAGGASATEDLAQYVDPFIGTLGAGFVFPGPAAPFGMVQLSPDTEGYFAYTGYQWIDQKIRGFSHVHVESMGVPEGGTVPFMPVTGTVSTDVQEYQSSFTHAREEASAGYYKVHLDTYDIDAELTAGLRTGMHRYTFPAGSAAHVLIDAGREIDGDTPDVSPERIPAAVKSSVHIDAATRTVLGTANLTPAGNSKYTTYFAARFDKQFSSYGTWSGRGLPVTQGSDTVNEIGAGAMLDFDTTVDRTVVAKVGISFVSEANALANLENELPGQDFGFDALRAETRAAWNDELHAIEIEGGTPLDRTAFYTALYHVMHHPNTFNDANGQYRGHDNAVHTIGSDEIMPVGSTYYANFSLWDTYRAEMPLLAAIAPDRYRDMMRSLRAIKLQLGRLPRWSLMYKDPGYMIGEPAIQTIADAFCRGLVPADAQTDLYNGIVALANGGGSEGKVGEFNGPKGYISGGVGASTTMELASADFALALVADARGDTANKALALTRADNYKNIIDPQTRWARPRDGTGWKTPYLPEDSAGFKEGTGWQYTWLAPHDYRGLFDTIGEGLGGDALVEQRLDEFFSTAAAAAAPHAVAEMQQKTSLYGIAFYGNQYSPANEHDLQAPYAYDWITPWKTQALSRAYQTLYRVAPDGLPGNDDLGTMSAWFVWSALGFYPEIPGSPVYVVGSPLFPRAVLHLDGGHTFTVDAPLASLASKYVLDAKLGTADLNKPWFTHDDLLAQDGITFTMVPAPNPLWGLGAPPPSMTGSDLADFACRT